MILLNAFQTYIHVLIQNQFILQHRFPIMSLPPKELQAHVPSPCSPHYHTRFKKHKIDEDLNLPTKETFQEHKTLSPFQNKDGKKEMGANLGLIIDLVKGGCTYGHSLSNHCLHCIKVLSLVMHFLWKLHPISHTFLQVPYKSLHIWFAY
jgi:hypothetical protein